jgi:Protein of unknown function (DUF2809)
MRYIVLALVTIAVGLIVYLAGSVLPPVVRDVLADALWAMMMVWWISAAAPRLPLRTRSLAALVVCVAVELSQRYHTPFLDAARRTLAGHLILGSGYDPRDLIAYAAGVVVAVVVDRVSATPPLHGDGATSVRLPAGARRPRRPTS